MIIGIIGIGFVGSAIMSSLKRNNFILNKDLFIYDKYKKDIENISINLPNIILNTDIVFLCLPTPYSTELKTYDINALDSSLDFLSKNNYQGVCLIKSTIVPGTTTMLSEKYSNLKIIHNPEFLSAKTAEEDFHNQEHIILGKTEKINYDDIELIKQFYEKYYTSNITIVKSTESELIKLSANCFYSIKIQYFTEIFLLCNKLDCSYNIVREGLLKNNWINPMHTQIPGSDGNISYGGLCFPKDTKALDEFMEINKLNHLVLNATINERDKMRNDFINII